MYVCMYTLSLCVCMTMFLYIHTYCMIHFNLHMTFWAAMRVCAFLPLTLIGTINNEASFPSLLPSNWNFLMCTTRFPAVKIIYMP